MQKDDNGMALSQVNLTQPIIMALGLQASYSTAKDTPAETHPLPHYSSGWPADTLILYTSIIGMLL